MGDDPKTSVTDSYWSITQCEERLRDGWGYFVSSGCQNPTLTLMAITVHACDRLIERYKKHEI
jgi:choline dehydrogenase-like flavoprotein